MSSSSSSSPTPLATATAFRGLTWSGSVPLQISLAADAPAGAGESYFVRPLACQLGNARRRRSADQLGRGSQQIQAPRNAYLSQYLQEVREGLVELALSEEQLAASRPSDWWFEDSSGGGRARWCVSGSPLCRKDGYPDAGRPSLVAGTGR
jgi:hypothetical protein